jgi:transposase
MLTPHQFNWRSCFWPSGMALCYGQHRTCPGLRELTGKLVLLRFVGLDLATAPWDHSTFMQNRTQRIAESGLLEQLCDETVALAIKQKLVSAHTMLDGTL